MRKGKKSIYLLGMKTHELEDLADTLGQPRFRGRQIAAWLYKRGVSDVNEMRDLPTDFRATLAKKAVLYRSKIVGTAKSPDGTTKYLLELEDGQRIESVLLPYHDRVSVCLSTQVGCAAGCVFCATGIGGMVRNLTAGEIVDELLTLQGQSPRRISHVAYMGMGEPLMNYDNLIRSIRLVNEEVGIAMRHITVSTVGITPRIDRLARDNLQITLAVSLHAPTDAVRTSIIPLAARYPLKDLIAACKRYADTTHRRITFEYLLIRDVNDSISMAHDLAALLKGILCNVNLIPYNMVEGLAMNRPTQAHVESFKAVLEHSGIAVTQRLERGHSVGAACGQLRRGESRE